MQEELTFYGSREKFIWMLVMGLCFVTLGCAGVFGMGDWFMGGAAIVFGLFGFVVTLLMMRPGSTYLRLDKQGFEMVAARRRYRYSWFDVDGFYLCQLHGAERVGIQFSPSCQSQRIGRAFAEGLTGAEGAIGNLYAATPKLLCATLNHWKVEHAERNAQLADA